MLLQVLLTNSDHHKITILLFIETPQYVLLKTTTSADAIFASQNDFAILNVS